MVHKVNYDTQFFAAQQDGSLKSALEIIPLVLNLLEIHSVVDVGCGTGTWLSVFEQFGVTDLLGIDGDYVDKRMLKIAPEQFQGMDLTEDIHLDRTYDLVVSLEVAEHLPERHANRFVESLTRLGSVILFSAAVPYQGGKHHVNEQWQSYWQEKFAGKGYKAVDCIRSQIWDNENVQWWYAQNILIYVQEDELKNYPKLHAEYKRNDGKMMSVIHPRLYMLLANDYFGEDGYKDGMIIGRKFTPRI